MQFLCQYLLLLFLVVLLYASFQSSNVISWKSVKKDFQRSPNFSFAIPWNKPLPITANISLTS